MTTPVAGSIPAPATCSTYVVPRIGSVQTEVWGIIACLRHRRRELTGKAHRRGDFHLVEIEDGPVRFRTHIPAGRGGKPFTLGLFKPALKEFDEFLEAAAEVAHGNNPPPSLGKVPRHVRHRRTNRRRD
ncbi:MAG: hypothetical protein QM775_16555 [Pirellulales bacterium]